MPAWSRFRGDNGAGIGDGAGFPSGPSKPLFAWECPLPGEGHSSPVVSDGQVFTTAADDSRRSAFLVRVDLKSGRIVWQVPIPYPTGDRHRFNAGASSTPVVGNGRVHVFTAGPDESTLTTFDFAGKRVWEHSLGGCKTQHGGGASPILVGSTVVIPVEPDHGAGSIWCLDSKTGSTVWKRSRMGADAPYSTPFVRKGLAGPEIVLTSTGWGVTALDPRDGATRWECGGLFRQRCVGSPIETPAGIVATSGSGGGDRKSVLVRPPTKDKPEPEVAWNMGRGTSYVPTPVLAGGSIVYWGDNGVVSAVDPFKGTLSWQERAGGNYFASPIVADSRVWNLSVEGDLVSFAVGADRPVFSRHSLGQESHATIALADNRMILRTRGRLFCLAGSPAKHR